MRKAIFLLYLFCGTYIDRCHAQGAASRYNLYISPAGNDASPGTLIKPLKTLGAALQRVAAVQETHVSIQLRKGRYAQEQTLRVTPAILSGHTLEITAYKTETAILTGAVPVKAVWKMGKGKLWTAFIGKGLSMDQLFCEGKALPMARYPNYDAHARIYHGTAEDAISPERVKRWANPAGGYVHALHESMWGSMDYLITAKDDSGNLVLEGGWQNNRPAPMHGQYRFVENIFEELDAPGEWYYNATTGTLYLYPPAGVTPGTAHFERTVSSDLINVAGTRQEPVRGVTIHGIGFEATSRTFMQTQEPLMRSDWTIYRGAALLLEGAEDCSVTDCSFSGIGGNAIMLSGYNRHDTVSGCQVSHTGASAVAFIGLAAAVRSPNSSFENNPAFAALDTTAGPLTADYPQACIVENCLLHNLGEVEKQAAGVEIQMASAITVQHNSIYNTPRAGINIGDGRWGGHVIAYNDVFNTVLETGDHGAFNSWGRDRFWASDRHYMDSLVADHPGLILLDALAPVIIRNNRFRCDHGWDIDLDDGSTNYRIYNNVCLNGGLKLREGFYREVYNNVLVNNTFHPHVWFEHSHDKFMHNIVMRPYLPIWQKYWGSGVDSNLFISVKALQAAQANGTDLHSLAGRPMFAAPSSGNYQVAQSSPALQAGFVNFPMEDVGVQKPAWKKIAQHPVMPVLEWDTTATQAAVETTLFGSKLKPVEGLGDRSAYGLPDEHGLIVIQAGEGTWLARSGLQDKDVIRTIAEKPVNTVQGLEDARRNTKGRMAIDIIRDQKVLHRWLLSE